MVKVLKPHLFLIRPIIIGGELALFDYSHHHLKNVKNIFF